MTDNRQRIDAYVRAFASYLIGSSDERERAKAELFEHLTDAAEVGELNEALERLGSPQAAAAAFAHERSRPPAPVSDRLVAATIDNLPLVAVALALPVQAIMQGSSDIAAAFPPFVYLQIGGACIAPLPFTPCGVYNGGLFYAVGISLALVWSTIGLGVLESFTGTTPGKRLMGLWVVNEEGIRITPHGGIIRRLSFLAGPLAWADWMPVLWGDRRRILDRLAATNVVTFRRPDRPRDTTVQSEAGDA